VLHGSEYVPEDAVRDNLGFSGRYVSVANGRTDVFVAEGMLGTFVMSLHDTTAPTATLSAPAPVNGTAWTSFTVSYSDNLKVNLSSIDSADIQITGPNSLSQTATFVGANQLENSSTIVATYRINAPGGAWDALDSGTEALDADARAREVGKAIARCREAGLEGAGIYEVRAGTIGDYGEIGPLAMANSRGLFAYHVGTSAEFLISALEGTASGWAGYESHRASGVDGSALSARAVEKAVRSRDPKAWEPGRYTVVLEPAAVADLIQDMSWISFGALLVQEGRSFLAGKIGQRVMGENITLRDDPFHPLHQGSPFDAEGMPTIPTTIIDRGVAKGAVYDRQTAAKEGRESTGHGLPVPNTYGPLARHLVLEGGKGGVEDLVRRVDRGLLVTRVWYTNVVDPKSVTLTGMTRDGLFAIEKGNVTHSVRNFRFNQSVVQMLNQVEGMSSLECSGGVVCPGLLVRDFHMSSATEF